MFCYLGCGNADWIKPRHAFNANKNRSAGSLKNGCPVPIHGNPSKHSLLHREIHDFKEFGLVSASQSRKQTVELEGLG